MQSMGSVDMSPVAAAIVIVFEDVGLEEDNDKVRLLSEDVGGLEVKLDVGVLC